MKTYGLEVKEGFHANFCTDCFIKRKCLLITWTMKQ